MPIFWDALEIECKKWTSTLLHVRNPSKNAGKSGKHICIMYMLNISMMRMLLVSRNVLMFFAITEFDILSRLLSINNLRFSWFTSYFLSVSWMQLNYINVTNSTIKQDLDSALPLSRAQDCVKCRWSSLSLFYSNLPLYQHLLPSPSHPITLHTQGHSLRSHDKTHFLWTSSSLEIKTGVDSFNPLI